MRNNRFLLSVIFGFSVICVSGIQTPQVFAVSEGAIIGNGEVILGVGYEGHLNERYYGNILGLPSNDPLGIGWIGLRDGTGLYASTEPGCLCEGWGVWIPETGGPGNFDDVWGASGIHSGGVGRNMDVEVFNGTNGGNTAISKVLIPNSEVPVLRVTHDYHPSPKTSSLYEVVVTIENLDEVDYDSVIYRRAMDWDIYPTPFSEYVTIKGTQTTKQLINSGDNGFIDVDPRKTGFSIGAPINQDFEDNGPSDHGAIFDFEAGPIPAGGSVKIITYYGVASSEVKALEALAAVKAEIFSLGQSNTEDGPSLGTPATFMFAFGNVGGIAVIPSEKNNSGSNEWDTRPTFGVSHETRQGLIVENGFKFNTEQFTLTDNHHTDFAEKSVEIGTTNSFSAKVYADKRLKVQEFLFGIPNVGESHLAELGIEVWYDFDGNIDDVKIIQKSDVIDADTVSVSHEKTKCLSTDQEPLCDTTTVSMKFLEPLKDKVMAIKAIDFKNRDQRTYLNEGFDISGTSLNPMQSKMIPSNTRNAGLIQVTQVEKYSPYWMADDGRMFEMNSFGSLKQINQKFERFQDKGNAFTRMHSGFGGIIDYEKNRAKQVFDSTKLISELPDSFGYHIEMKERLGDEMKQNMIQQEEIAQGILEQMDKQNRHY